MVNGSNVASSYPCYLSGPVIPGFKRGSKEIGYPTANYPEASVNKLPSDFDQGVYFGWAQINDGPVYKMVLSIGNNPYYKNEKKTIVRGLDMHMLKETYIMHKFPGDLYGSDLRVVILGYLRPMVSYDTLGELIEAIGSDVERAEMLLELAENQVYQSDSFFLKTVTSKI